MTDPTTRVRAILDAATPGPWWAFDEPAETRGVYGPDGDELARVQGNLALGGDALDNARAIVVARNLAPELLAVAEAAENVLYIGAVRPFRDTAEDRLGAALDALYAKMKETLG